MQRTGSSERKIGTTRKDQIWAKINEVEIVFYL